MIFSAPLVECALWFMQRTRPLMIRSWAFAVSKRINRVDKKNNFCMVKSLMVNNENALINRGNAFHKSIKGEDCRIIKSMLLVNRLQYKINILYFRAVYFKRSCFVFITTMCSCNGNFIAKR